MKTILSLIICVGMIACLHTGDTQKKVSIHPFYPYVEQDSLLDGNQRKDSMLSKYYIIYHLNTEDTAAIRHLLQPYADSVVSAYPKFKFFVFTFYKTGRGFDSTYNETRTDPLFDYGQNLVAEYYHIKNTDRKNMHFYKQGVLIGNNEIKIEDIPANDSILPNN